MSKSWWRAKVLLSVPEHEHIWAYLDPTTTPSTVINLLYSQTRTLEHGAKILNSFGNNGQIVFDTDQHERGNTKLSYFYSAQELCHANLHEYVFNIPVCSHLGGLQDSNNKTCLFREPPLSSPHNVSFVPHFKKSIKPQDLLHLDTEQTSQRWCREWQAGNRQHLMLITESAPPFLAEPPIPVFGW